MQEYVEIQYNDTHLEVPTEVLQEVTESEEYRNFKSF